DLLLQFRESGTTIRSLIATKPKTIAPSMLKTTLISKDTSKKSIPPIEEKPKIEEIAKPTLKGKLIDKK
ncbi:MAG: hypothetical protein NZ108_09960, partial [Bacteroidia bacterium]|nr:hypothetical protein [Bacteroidia bacterium]